MIKVTAKRRMRRGEKVWVVDVSPEASADRRRKIVTSPDQTSGGAHDYAQRILRDAIDGRKFVAPTAEPATPPKGRTLGDVYAAYEAERMPSPRNGQWIAAIKPYSCDRYRALWKQAVGPMLGDVPIAEIDESKLRAFAGKAQAGEHPGARKRGRAVQPRAHVNFVRGTLLRFAVEKGWLSELPKRPGDLCKQPKKLPTAPDDEDVEKIITEATGYMLTGVMLAALAGLRLGEVLGLEVQDVDLRRGVITVRRGLSWTATGDAVTTTTKGDAERVVPLDPRLAGVLVDAVRDKLPRARIVVQANGKTPLRQNVLSRLSAICDRAGIGRRSFHSLRHAFVSSLIRRGASLEAVRALAGHTQLAVTQRYAHATADDLRDAIGRLAAPRRP